MSNSLTKDNESNKISSPSQAEAGKSGDNKMSINIENLVKEHGKEWVSPEGAKRVYFNGESAIEFLTILSESSETSMPVPASMGKNKLFQLKNGVFATDDGKIANVLRAAGLEVIRSDKAFSKIKSIEKPTSTEKKESAKKAAAVAAKVESNKSPLDKISDKIQALHQKMEAHKKEHGMDEAFSKMNKEKSALVSEKYALEKVDED